MPFRQVVFCLQVWQCTSISTPASIITETVGREVQSPVPTVKCFHGKFIYQFYSHFIGQHKSHDHAWLQEREGKPRRRGKVSNIVNMLYIFIIIITFYWLFFERRSLLKSLSLVVDIPLVSLTTTLSPQESEYLRKANGFTSHPFV